MVETSVSKLTTKLKLQTASKTPSLTCRILAASLCNIPDYSLLLCSISVSTPPWAPSPINIKTSYKKKQATNHLHLICSSCCSAHHHHNYKQKDLAPCLALFYYFTMLHCQSLWQQNLQSHGLLQKSYKTKALFSEVPSTFGHCGVSRYCFCSHLIWYLI